MPNCVSVDPLRKEYEELNFVAERGRRKVIGITIYTQNGVLLALNTTEEGVSALAMGKPGEAENHVTSGYCRLCVREFEFLIYSIPYGLKAETSFWRDEGVFKLKSSFSPIGIHVFIKERWI